MLYFKKADTIADFLTCIGAPICAMDVISAKVDRDMRNKITRATNCDNANIDKTIFAAESQIEAIHRYASLYGLDSLPDTLRDTAYLRIMNPSASLSDLAKLSYPPVTKSCLAYRLKKINEMIRLPAAEEPPELS